MYSEKQPSSFLTCYQYVPPILVDIDGLEGILLKLVQYVQPPVLWRGNRLEFILTCSPVTGFKQMYRHYAMYATSAQP